MNSAKRGSADEKFADEALDMFDAWREALKPGDVYPGAVTATEANRMFNEANRLWTIKKKSDTINDIVFKAEGEVGSAGFEKSLRDQFKALAKNKNKMRAFEQEEQDAIRNVSGGMIRKLLAATNKLMPSQSLGAVASAGFVNPVPTAMATAGSVARMGVNKSTRNALNKVQATTRSGGQVPFDPIAAKEAETYAGRLLSAGGQPGGRYVLDLGDTSIPGSGGGYITAR